MTQVFLVTRERSAIADDLARRAAAVADSRRRRKFSKQEEFALYAVEQALLKAAADVRMGQEFHAREE